MPFIGSEPTLDPHLAGVTGVSLAQHCMAEARNDAAAVQGVPHKLLHLRLAGRLSNLCAANSVIRFQALLHLSHAGTPPLRLSSLCAAIMVVTFHALLYLSHAGTLLLPCWAPVQSVCSRHGGSGSLLNVSAFAFTMADGYGSPSLDLIAAMARSEALLCLSHARPGQCWLRLAHQLYKNAISASASCVHQLLGNH